MNLKEKKYVVFADDWAQHPSSCQHLFKRIDAPILWINTVMRMPKISMYDAKRVWQKFFVRKNSSKQSNVVIKRIFMIPIFTKFFRRLNKILFFLQLKIEIDQIVVTTLPIIADFIENIKCSKKVYYCVDEFSEWPGHNKQQMLAMEQKLLKIADIVIVTSETLYQAKKKFCNNIELLTHGVDIEHFQKKEVSLLNITAPIIGYFGLFDERSDISLLKYILEKHRNWHIVIIGPVAINVSVFEDYDNIHFYGKVDYENLPSYVHNFNVCILPYVINELTQYINPLKFKEYLSTEIPVVTTALPVLEQYRDVISWAEDDRQFLQYISFYLYKEEIEAKKNRIMKSKKILQGESWEQKSIYFQQLLCV